MFESMSKPQYIIGFALSIALVLLVAVFAVDIVVRSAYSLSDTFRPVLERLGWDGELKGDVAVEVPERPVASAPVRTAPQRPPVVTKTRPAPAPVAQPTPAVVAYAAPVPRVSNALMTYSAFGTYWNGSFIAQDELNPDDIPAIRVMIYNSGNAPTAAWTLHCSFGGHVSQTVGYQAPLGAGERAFAVCDTSPLGYGIHAVSVSYQETGKAPQEILGTIAVQ